MKQSIQRFIEIQQNRGTVSALRSTKSHIGNRTKANLKDKYWAIRGGTQTLSIGDTSAEFDATTNKGGEKIRWMYDAEDKFLQDLVSDLNKDDIFFDIGANLGIFSCFAAQVISQGHVVAFEPYPPNTSQLKQNLSYNANKSDYDVLDVALSDSQGTIDFTAPNDDPGKQTGHIDPTSDSIAIQAVPGDQLVGDGSIPSPSVVKIDVEGSEPLVIDGMENSLNNSTCRLLYCEIHLPSGDGGRPSVEDYDESIESMLEKISELGFEIVYNELRGKEVHIKAKK